MSVLAITFSFSPDTTIFSSEVNQNFNEIAVWANGNITQANLATFTGGVDFSLAGSDHALSITSSSSTSAISIVSTGPASPFVLEDDGTSGAIPALQVISTTRGTLPFPVMTATQKNSVSSPPDGLMVFDSTAGAPAWHSSGQWHSVVSNGSTRLNVISTSINATLPDISSLVSVDATSGAITITLPIYDTGLEFIISKKDSSFNIVTINDATNALLTTLNTQGEAVTIASTSSSWVFLSRVIPSIWQNYSPTLTALGTQSFSQFSWRRVGDSVEILGDLLNTAAGSASVVATITLPHASLLVNPNCIHGSGYQYVGSGAYGNSNFQSITVLVGSNDNTFEFGVIQATTGNGLVPQVGGKIVGTTDRVAFKATIPIKGWN